MSLLLKIQKTLVTFSLTLRLRWGYLTFQNFRETRKGTWYHKIFEERGEIRKIKIQMSNVWLLTCSRALNMKKKIKYRLPRRNEMLSLYYTALGFKVKMKNIIPNEMHLTVSIWKTWYYKNLLSNIHNKLKYRWLFTFIFNARGHFY